MKKHKLLLVVIIGVALCGCGQSAGSEIAGESYFEIVDSNISETVDDNISETADESISETETPAYTDIAQGGPYGKVSISLPDGWDYELCPIDSDKLLSCMYGIHFWPEGAADGYVELAYEDNFGVCGMGLEEKSVTVAGNPANIGTYDNNSYWDFISFRGENEGIVALTYSVDDWWSEYGSQVLGILDTLSFDQDDKEGGAYIYSRESEADKIGLHISLKNISPEGATLVFHQYDAKAPTGELQHGSEFVLELFKDDKWEEAPIVIEGKYGFNAAAYRIPAGESTEVELSWEWLYGKLPAGEYRIRKRVDDFRGSGDYDEYTLYAQFILN